MLGLHELQGASMSPKPTFSPVRIQPPSCGLEVAQRQAVKFQLYLANVFNSNVVVETPGRTGQLMGSSFRAVLMGTEARLWVVRARPRCQTQLGAALGGGRGRVCAGPGCPLPSVLGAPERPDVSIDQAAWEPHSPSNTARRVPVSLAPLPPQGTPVSRAAWAGWDQTRCPKMPPNPTDNNASDRTAAQQAADIASVRFQNILASARVRTMYEKGRHKFKKAPGAGLGQALSQTKQKTSFNVHECQREVWLQKVPCISDGCSVLPGGCAARRLAAGEQPEGRRGAGLLPPHSSSFTAFWSSSSSRSGSSASSRSSRSWVRGA